jgi:hypothetical protein
MGEFEIEIPIDKTSDKHRCQQAREYVSDTLGKALVEAWVIQKATPIEKPYEDNQTWYKFGGNIRISRVKE